MEDSVKSPGYDEITREAPQLAVVLKEMKEGLDTVRNKIQALTSKVKANNFPTSEGMSYLEVKHLLLLNYCQSLVYFLLRKAKGLSIQGHPVVRSLVEMRLFLEKIRPIDKKLQYQIQKLTKTTTAEKQETSVKKESNDAQMSEDLLKYRPNPDLLISKVNEVEEGGGGVYKPPKFAPSSMDESKTSRQERNARRKEQDALRRAKHSDFVKELMDKREGKPEEIREQFGLESREMAEYASKMEERNRQEEEFFTRAPLSKADKIKMKQLKKPRNGLLGLTESFFDEIKSLPIDGIGTEQSTSFNNNDNFRERKFRKRKRKH